MRASKGCKNTVVNEMLNLLNIRQVLLNKQEDVNTECYEIDIKIRKMRNHYGLQIEVLQKRLEECDYSAVGELQSLWDEFSKDFKKEYYRQLKLRRESEQIQDKLFKIIDKMQDL